MIMITTAILRDKKGFQKSIEIPDSWPEVSIPLYEEPSFNNIRPGDADDIPVSRNMKMTFVKDYSLGVAYGRNVVMYKEK